MPSTARPLLPPAIPNPALSPWLHSPHVLRRPWVRHYLGSTLQAANRSLQEEAWAVRHSGAGSAVDRDGRTSAPDHPSDLAWGPVGRVGDLGDGSQGSLDRDPSPRHGLGSLSSGAWPLATTSPLDRGRDKPPTGAPPVKQVFITTPARFMDGLGAGREPGRLRASPGASSSGSSPLGVFEGHNDFLFDDPTV